MKILFDYQIFSSQVYGGVSRYFFELMRHFREMGEPQFELALSYSKNYYINQAYDNGLPFFKKPKLPPLFRKPRTINMCKSKKVILKQGFDIFHPTYYDPYFLDYLKDKPYVLTIYDMIHEIFASQFPASDKTSENKKKLAQKARKIIAISESTKRDILKFYDGIGEEKVSVTHLASCLTKYDAKIPDIETPSRYILFVGGRRVYHKNFQFFINSLKTLITADRELHIICAGAKPFKPFEIDLFSRLGIENQLHHISTADETLVWLYKNALAFVLPSLYEGFGIPVLEAFACGCPAVLSDTSSIPEVGGDAAVYFDPKSAESIREAVTKVIYNEGLRQNLISKGLKRSQNFSWAKTAEKTLSTYRSVL